MKLYTQLSRLEIGNNTIAVRVSKAWNSLPDEVVMSCSVKAFVAKLDKHWNEQPVKFDYKETCRP